MSRQSQRDLDREQKGNDPTTLLDSENSGRATETLDPSIIDTLEPSMDCVRRVELNTTAARIRVLWVQRAFLCRVALLGVVIAALIAFIVPKRYSANAHLMPPQDNDMSAAAMLSSVMGRAGGLMPSMEGILGLRTTGDLFVGILQSQGIEDGVIRKFDLEKLYRTRYIEDARKVLREHTEITVDPKSGIISLTVTDRDPQRAAAMARQYIEGLNAALSSLNVSQAHRERVFLEQRLTQVKADLESAEQEFGKFSSQKGTIDLPAQGRAMFQAAADLQGQLIATQSELEGMRQIYTTNNVRVRALEARAAELRKQLEKIGGSSASETSSIDELYPSIRELPLLGVSYADLLRRVKVQEVIYETLTQQYELAKVREAKEIPTVGILDAPLVPEKKSFPPRLIITILGGALALAAAIGWILGQAAWTQMDNNDPSKALFVEIFTDVRQAMTRNSDHAGRLSTKRIWRLKQ